MNIYKYEYEYIENILSRSRVASAIPCRLISCSLITKFAICNSEHLSRMPYDSYNRFLKLAKALSAGLREISKFHFILAFSLPFLYTAVVTGTIEENKSVATAVKSIFKLRKFHFLYKRAMAQPRRQLTWIGGGHWCRSQVRTLRWGALHVIHKCMPK